MNRVIKFRAWDKEGKFMTDPFFLGSFNAGGGFDPNWEVMQFTGLLDKDGRDIYEGDVLEVPTRGKSTWNCKVEFSEGGFRALPTVGPEDDFDLIDVVDCPIIGNIYEHPHLIASNP